MKFKVKARPAAPAAKKAVFPIGRVAEKHVQHVRLHEDEQPHERVLAGLQSIAEVQETLRVYNSLSKRSEIHPVVRVTNLAKLLGMSYQTVWRWSSDTGQLPNPVLFDQSQGRELGVYHVEEVRVILSIVAQHLKGFRYYRKDHHNTIHALNDALETIRNAILTGDTHGNQTKGRPGVRKVIRRR